MMIIKGILIYKYKRCSIRIHNCNWNSSIMTRAISPYYNSDYVFCTLRFIKIISLNLIKPQIHRLWSVSSRFITRIILFNLDYVKLYLWSIFVAVHYYLKIHLILIHNDDFNKHTLRLAYRKTLFIEHKKQSICVIFRGKFLRMLQSKHSTILAGKF